MYATFFKQWLQIYNERLISSMNSKLPLRACLSPPAANQSLSQVTDADAHCDTRANTRAMNESEPKQPMQLGIEVRNVPLGDSTPNAPLDRCPSTSIIGLLNFIWPS